MFKHKGKKLGLNIKLENWVLTSNLKIRFKREVRKLGLNIKLQNQV